MEQFLIALKILGEILPLILSLVKQFEMPGFGDAKKEGVLEVVKKTLEGIVQMGGNVPVSVVLTLASAVIDGAVYFYNVVGVFKKTAAAATVKE